MSVDEKTVASSTNALSTLNLNNTTACSSNTTLCSSNNTSVMGQRRASRVGGKLPSNVNEEILKNFRRFSNASNEMSPIHTSNSSSLNELGATTTRLADQIKLRKYFFSIFFNKKVYLTNYSFVNVSRLF